MALIDRIPMPKSGGEAFFEGATNTQDILSKILAGKQNQQKLIQDALANEQLNKYRMGELGVAQHAEARAQQQMPYLIQQYKDAHQGKITENETNKLKLQALREQWQNLQSGQAAFNQSSNQTMNDQQTQEPQRRSLQDIVEPALRSKYQLQQPAMRNGQQTAQQQIAQPELTGFSPTIPAMPKMPAMQTNGSNQDYAQEIVITPARPGFESLDKYAGTSFGDKITTKPTEDGQYILKTYPSGKVTVTSNPVIQNQKIQQEGKIAYEKTLGEQEAKKLSTLEDIAIAGMEAEPTYQKAAGITSSPTWANMRDFPIAPRLQLEYYKRNGTSEQRKMIGDFQTAGNQFILDSVKKFPQRFTNQDMNFVRSMKMSDHDSLEAAQAKLEGAWAYDQIMTKRAILTADIAREKHLPVYKAMIEANKQLNIDEIRNTIKNKVVGAQRKDSVGFRNKDTGEFITDYEAKERGII